MLAELDLERFLDEPTESLSGGKRRRAEVALALLRAPRCLLADEPLAGIGPLDAELIAGSIRRLARGGCAVVVTGHEVPGLLAFADDLVWMTAGTTHGLGSVQAAVAHEQFRREYLGPGSVLASPVQRQTEWPAPGEDAEGGISVSPRRSRTRSRTRAHARFP